MKKNGEDGERSGPAKDGEERGARAGLRLVGSDHAMQVRFALILRPGLCGRLVRFRKRRGLPSAW